MTDKALPDSTSLIELMGHTFFTDKDSTLRTDIPYRSYGVAGDPVPYSVRTDNTITILLLLCFVVFIVSLARTKHYIVTQAKEFFSHHSTDDDRHDTGGEMHFLMFLSIVDALVLAISTSLLATDFVGGRLFLNADVWLIAGMFAAFVAYFCLKWMVGSMVNIVFFGVKKNLQWMTMQLQVTALEGVLLFPMLTLQIYFDFSSENAIIFICFVLFLNKIITFYKSFQIFFQGNGLYLQTFLYFCALEIAPLLAFCGAGLAIMDLIKINF
jgi:hypothetical protein